MDMLKLYVQALEAMKKRAMTTHGFGHLVVNTFHLLMIDSSSKAYYFHQQKFESCLYL